MAAAASAASTVILRGRVNHMLTHYLVPFLFNVIKTHLSVVLYLSVFGYHSAFSFHLELISGLELSFHNTDNVIIRRYIIILGELLYRCVVRRPLQENE